MPRRSAKRPKPPPIILCSRAVFSADPSVTKNLLYNKDNTFGGKSQEGNTEKSPDFFASILSALHRIAVGCSLFNSDMIYYNTFPPVFQPRFRIFFEKQLYIGLRQLNKQRQIFDISKNVENLLTSACFSAIIIAKGGVCFVYPKRNIRCDMLFI